MSVGHSEGAQLQRLDAFWERFAREIEAGQGRADFQVRGLNLFPTTVFAQLLATAPTSLVALRQRITGELAVRGLTGHGVGEYEDSLHWDLAFANVARFLRTLQATMPARVAPYRQKDYGTWQLDTLDLVVTDKFLSSASTTLLKRYRLTDAARRVRTAPGRAAAPEGVGDTRVR